MTDTGPVRRLGEPVTVAFPNTSEVQKYLKFATGFLKWNGEEQTIDAFPLFDGHLLVLRSLVSIEPQLTLDERHRLIQDAVCAIHRAGEIDAEAFRRSLVEQIEQYVDRSPIAYRVVIPLNVADAGLSEIDLLGVRLRGSTWPSVDGAVQVDQWFFEARTNRASDLERVKVNSTPFVAEIAARDPHEAFRRVNDVFHLFRSAYNLLDIENSFVAIMGHRNLGTLLPPPLYGVFNDAGVCEATYTSPLGRRFDAVRLTPERAAEACSMLREATAPDASETRTMLVDLLRLYGHAVDTADRSDAFLNFWRTLEFATFGGRDRRYDMADVAKRATALLDNDEVDRAFLTALSRIRNDLVHRGHFADEGLKEIELLRKMVEACIDSLRKFAAEFPTWEELEQFYEYAPASSQPTGVRQLGTKQRVIELILQRSAAKAT